MRLARNRSLVSWNAPVDFEGPALYPACQRLRTLDPLSAQPYGYVHAPHTMMTIADDVLVHIKRLKIRRDRAHRDQLCAFNAAQLVFPRLATVKEKETALRLHDLH